MDFMSLMFKDYSMVDSVCGRDTFLQIIDSDEYLESNSALVGMICHEMCPPFEGFYQDLRMTVRKWEHRKMEVQHCYYECGVMADPSGMECEESEYGDQFISGVKMTTEGFCVFDNNHPCIMNVTALDKSQEEWDAEKCDRSDPGPSAAQLEATCSVCSQRMMQVQLEHMDATMPEMDGEYYYGLVTDLMHFQCARDWEGNWCIKEGMEWLNPFSNPVMSVTDGLCSDSCSMMQWSTMLALGRFNESMGMISVPHLDETWLSIMCHSAEGMRCGDHWPDYMSPDSEGPIPWAPLTMEESCNIPSDPVEEMAELPHTCNMTCQNDLLAGVMTFGCCFKEMTVANPHFGMYMEALQTTCGLPMPGVGKCPQHVPEFNITLNISGLNYWSITDGNPLLMHLWESLGPELAFRLYVPPGVARMPVDVTRAYETHMGRYWVTTTVTFRPASWDLRDSLVHYVSHLIGFKRGFWPQEQNTKLYMPRTKALIESTPGLGYFDGWPTEIWIGTDEIYQYPYPSKTEEQCKGCDGWPPVDSMYSNLCKLPHSWGELFDGYHNTQCSLRFKTGGLGPAQVDGRFEVWACVPDEPCADIGDYFCYVYDEMHHDWCPWGKNGDLRLVSGTGSGSGTPMPSPMP